MDDIERRLRDLGEWTAEKFASGPIPSVGVVRRARLRKGLMAFGSLGLVGLLAIGGYAGVNGFVEGSPRTITGNVFDAATRATEEQGSARIEFDMTSRSEGTSSQDFEAHGSGEIDFAARRSHMRFELEGTPARSDTLELIVADTEAYMTSLSWPDDKWMKIDLGSAGQTGTLGIGQWDPTGILESLDSVADEIEIMGRDEVAGVAVTHYRAILDPQEATEGSADVWIDEQELVRMIRFETSSETARMPLAMVYEMRFFDYGAQVHIELPDPGDVTEEDLGSLAESDESGSVGERSFFLVGADGFQGPVVIFTQTEGVPQGCLGGAPAWVTGAELVDESSGEVIAVIEPPEGSSHFESAEVLCLGEDRPGNLRSSLRRDPTRYTLRLKGGGKVLTVPLMSAEPLELRPNDQD
ncbi:MAG: hypothetical protein ACRDLB_16485 [Actinomycetota bacterium]